MGKKKAAARRGRRAQKIQKKVPFSIGREERNKCQGRGLFGEGSWCGVRKEGKMRGGGKKPEHRKIMTDKVG